jgi:hypothetical protein
MCPIGDEVEDENTLNVDLLDGNTLSWDMSDKMCPIGVEVEDETSSAEIC